MLWLKSGAHYPVYWEVKWGRSDLYWWVLSVIILGHGCRNFRLFQFIWMELWLRNHARFLKILWIIAAAAQVIWLKSLNMIYFSNICHVEFWTHLHLLKCVFKLFMICSKYSDTFASSALFPYSCWDTEHKQLLANRSISVWLTHTAN